MNYRTILLGGLTAALISLSHGALAQELREDEHVPAFEYHAVIQRLDPASGVVFAGGRNYHLQPDSRVWINNRPAKQAELSPDMIGLRIGLDAYEHESRNLITRMQVLENEGRANSVVGDKP